ncbi:hypothetical protein PMAYCL1PPCAC_13147, partial [Pristionchus mayeri]
DQDVSIIVDKQADESRDCVVVLDGERNESSIDDDAMEIVEEEEIVWDDDPASVLPPQPVDPPRDNARPPSPHRSPSPPDVIIADKENRLEPSPNMQQTTLEKEAERAAIEQPQPSTKGGEDSTRNKFSSIAAAVAD